MHTEAFFTALEGGYDSNFTYLIGCPKTKQLALIDCSVPMPLIEQGVQQAQKQGYLNISKVFLTHAHADHVAFLQPVNEKYQPAIYAHRWEFDRIKKLTGIELQNFINPDDTIELGEEKIHCLHTPGHQPSCICFVWRNKIFTGDTLFVEGCGRCDFPESSYDEQLESLRFIANCLPNELEVHPGHNYGSIPYSTIGREKITNRYLIGLLNEEFDVQQAQD